MKFTKDVLYPDTYRLPGGRVFSVTKEESHMRPCTYPLAAVRPQARPMGGPPGAPVLSVSSYDDTTITLSWTTPSGSPTSYNIYKGGVLYANVAASPSVVSGLSANTTYALTVTGVNGTGEGPVSNTATQKTAKVVTQTISATGLWNSNTVAGFVGASLRLIECWGGGAGGTGATSVGKAGGGGGAYAAKNNFTITINTGYTATVGIGGAGGTAGVNGSSGNDSWFSTSGTVLAKGGSVGTSITGGVGGVAGSCIGDVVHSGGTGGNGLNANPAGGGGGGGSANSSVDGGTGNNPVAGTGGTGQGAGGAGGNTGLTGNVGIVPGGGGGGGARSFSSGAGADGRIVLTYLTD